MRLPLLSQLLSVPSNKEAPLPSPCLTPAKMHLPPPGLPEVTESLPPPPAPITSPPLEALEKLPSVGAALHGTGMCKPCGWFHKEGGCRNGQDCRHCHLCPAGRFGAFKKDNRPLKKDRLRAAAAEAAAEIPAPA